MAEPLNLLSVELLPDWTISVTVSVWVGGVLLLLGLSYIARKLLVERAWKSFEIDEAEIGVGSSKIKLRPNLDDRQVAYAIWVELSTRKIGLPIDFDHDVVAEIYDSWYHFFAVTRELVKSVPVKRVRSSSTQAIVKLSIEVLNEGLRPHLTQWQARFRRWYDNEINKTSGELVIDPQDIQKNFPRFDELRADMEQVNKHLMRYREKMRQLVIE
ncbi:hypothetical protein [Constrictibacter sp. MBR-5]|uniref:hypothetical protein n=1 Tax=Constrictibacter sp. MBR-5 TaxID=3156467 RepID=UPI003394FC08